MNTIGFFKFHRELFGKTIWEDSTPEQKVILITLLGMVNYEKNIWEYKGNTYTVDAGEVITSIPTIIENCGKGVSVQNVKTGLKRFVDLDFIKDEPVIRNLNRKITIVNWDKYQAKNDRKTDKKLTDVITDSVTDALTEVKNAESLDIKGIERNEGNELTDILTNGVTDVLTPIKEVKEIKNNNTSIQQAEQFNLWWDLYNKKIGKAKCELAFIKLLKKYEYSIIEVGTKRYLTYLQTNNVDKQFQKNPLTFINGLHFMDEYETSFVQTTTPAKKIEPVKINYDED